MKIIEQSHEIISLPENLLETIELAGRTCYQSEKKIGCSIKRELDPYDHCEKYCPPMQQYETLSGKRINCNSECENHTSQKFVKMLRDKKHHAMIEFGDIIVKFITNRGVTHELVRHRHCSFAQESTRYVNYKGEMEFILPVWWENTHRDEKAVWIANNFATEEYYKRLLEFGWRPEQARDVLPNSIKTEIVVKANIREWRHIFELRTSKKSHPQIRALMTLLLLELKELLPIVFDDINI